MRLPKPFFRKFTKSWYVEIRGRQINLGRDRAAAKAKYQQLVAHLDSGDGFVTSVHELLANTSAGSRPIARQPRSAPRATTRGRLPKRSASASRSWT